MYNYGTEVSSQEHEILLCCYNMETLNTQQSYAVDKHDGTHVC